MFLLQSLKKIFRPPIPQGNIWNLVTIALLISEDTASVDGQTKNDGRMTETAYA